MHSILSPSGFSLIQLHSIDHFIGLVPTQGHALFIGEIIQGITIARRGHCLVPRLMGSSLCDTPLTSLLHVFGEGLLAAAMKLFGVQQQLNTRPLIVIATTSQKMCWNPVDSKAWIVCSSKILVVGQLKDNLGST